MEEASKVIVVVAKVEREEQGNDERATNVVRQCRQGRGDRVDNGLKIETVKKTRRKGAIQHGTFTLVV